MSERFMENIRVSAEVKTYLKELYNQIEYELRDDYKDSLEKTTNILTELEEWLKDYIPMLEAGDMIEEATQDTLKEVLDKIQELKEKYKC